MGGNIVHSILLVFFVSVTILILSTDNAFAVAPVANAGPDQSVVKFSTVTLDGSGSTDDGTIVSYSWEKLPPMKNLFTFSPNSNVVSPQFTTIEVSSQTMYTFKLTVEDDEGLTDDDTVVITVNTMMIL